MQSLLCGAIKTGSCHGGRGKEQAGKATAAAQWETTGLCPGWEGSQSPSMAEPSKCPFSSPTRLLFPAYPAPKPISGPSVPLALMRIPAIGSIHYDKTF